ncbi:MAG: ATP-binding protein [Actinomycetota bacterium]
MVQESSNPNLGSENKSNSNTSIPVRIAIYDNMRSIPRVEEYRYGKVADFINETSQKTYSLSHGIGGKIPYTIIKELIENLIHANFNEIIITILDNGNHIIISDQGPGIDDKNKAFLPGHTSATQSMKEYIRGVGSGLPIVKETITFSGGSINISDNIKSGTVVSLKIDTAQTSPSDNRESKPATQAENPETDESYEDIYDLKLSGRQIKIMSLILELENAGPSIISNELGFSLSTSYRELIYLENKGFLTSNSSGKRALTQKGIKYLEYYSNNF